MSKKCLFIKDGFLSIAMLCVLAVSALALYITSPEETTVVQNRSIDTQTATIYTASTQTEVPQEVIETSPQTEAASTSSKPIAAPITNTKEPTVTKTPIQNNTVTSIKTPPLPSPNTNVLEEDTVFIQALISSITAQTNQYRKTNNLAAFSSNTQLARTATKYSEQMLTEDFFSHTTPSGCDLTCRFNANGYSVQAWGENLAYYSFSTQPKAEEVASYFMKQWEKSDGHRDNLLSDTFTNQGIGVAADNKHIYVTVQFTKAK